MINSLKAKTATLERESTHNGKILRMKRLQIEDEKTALVKRQTAKQRSVTRDALSATRLQQQLEAKKNVVEKEREAKKALKLEKERLELEINKMRKDRDRDNLSAKGDESQSVYFARS